jgi:hypothetical protein
MRRKAPLIKAHASSTKEEKTRDGAASEEPDEPAVLPPVTAGPNPAVLLPTGKSEPNHIAEWDASELECTHKGEGRRSTVQYLL